MAEANLAVIITGRGKELINEFRKIGTEAEIAGKKTASGWDKAKQGIRVAGAAIAGTALAVGVASVHMADDYEKSHIRLEVALKNTHTSWEAQKKAINAVSDASVKFGYTKTDVEGALASMTRGMGSASKAMKYFQLAEDLAAAKGLDLNTAAMLVTKASEGQIRPLKQLGIDLPVAAAGAYKTKVAYEKWGVAQEKLKQLISDHAAGLVKTSAFEKQYAIDVQKVTDAHTKFNTVAGTGTFILGQLGKILGGSASAQAKTFEGRTKALKAEMGNLGIKIGMFLMPFLLKLVTDVQHVVTWFQKGSSGAKAAEIAIAALGGAILVANGIMLVHKAITVASTAATLVWKGVQIAIAGVTKAWTAAQWLLNGALSANPIGAVITAVWLLVAGVIYAYKHFKWFHNAVDAAWQILQGIADWLSNGPFSGAFAAAESAVKPLADSLYAISHFKMPDLGGNFNSLGKSFTNLNPFNSTYLPGHAAGGMVNYPASGALAVLHGRELILPMNDPHRSGELLAGSGLVGSGGGSTTIVNVTVNGIVSGHAHDIGKFIVDHAIQYERRTGKRWLNVVTPV